MINKSDVVLLLTELQQQGIDVSNELELVFNSQSIPLNVLKKINDNKQLDLLNFYEKLRKSYNQKKSKLYINIMRADEQVITSPKTVLTTLSALLNQILQYDASDKIAFYKHSRCEEIVSVLNTFFTSYNLEPAVKLLTLYKCDIKALESIR